MLLFHAITSEPYPAPEDRSRTARLKIIFSRKGFDSSAGGCPSPIIDGHPLSLPIPWKTPTGIRYGDLSGAPYGALVQDLTKGKLTPQHSCHLDPDITAACLPRETGWRGAFGQVAAAQAHLANQDIQPGDLFLFWGLFRPVEHTPVEHTPVEHTPIGHTPIGHTMHWRFTGKPHHRIWGWLQIGQIIDLGPDGTQVTTQHPWLRAHPHARPGWSHPNVLYVASESLTIDGRHLPLPGHGTLKRGHGLTAPATNGTQANCSLWRLPDWLNPKRGGTGLTYHPLARWNDDGTLRSAPRGQEFVCLPPRTPQIAAWITTLLTNTLV